jgi:hypothetical protein
VLDVLYELARDADTRVGIEQDLRPRSGGFDNVVVCRLYPPDREPYTVELAANDKESRLWLDGHVLRFAGRGRMAETRLCIEALVAGRYKHTAQPVRRRGRLALRDRDYTQHTIVVDTADGPRRFTESRPADRARRDRSATAATSVASAIAGAGAPTAEKPVADGDQ